MVGTDIGPRQSLARRAARGLLLLSILFLAVFGAAILALELYFWRSGVRWTPADINAIIVADSPARRLMAGLWENLKFVIQYGSYFIAAVAFAVAITQIKTVAKLISDFIEARGPIYALGTTITQVEASVAALSGTVDRLSKLEPTIKEIAAKIEGTYAQLASLQRLQVSERSDAGPDSVQPTDGPSTGAAISSTEDHNWERLRELWNANGERLDEVIENIPDKRRRTRFQRMPRTNYPAIIDALAEADFLSEAARNASQELHATFMSYKPRNRKIPNSAVAALEVLDKMLEHELRSTVDTEPLGTV